MLTNTVHDATGYISRATSVCAVNKQYAHVIQYRPTWSSYAALRKSLDAFKTTSIAKRISTSLKTLCEAAPVAACTSDDAVFFLEMRHCYKKNTKFNISFTDLAAFIFRRTSCLPATTYYPALPQRCTRESSQSVEQSVIHMFAQRAMYVCAGIHHDVSRGTQAVHFTACASLYPRHEREINSVAAVIVLPQCVNIFRLILSV